MTFVSDTIEGFLQAASAPDAVGQVINLGSGRAVSIGELAQVIVNLLGSHKEIITAPERYRPESSEVWHLECDKRRAQALLGWSPQVSLEEGLRRTVEFIGAHKECYKTELYNI